MKQIKQLTLFTGIDTFLEPFAALNQEKIYYKDYH